MDERIIRSPPEILSIKKAQGNEYRNSFTVNCHIYVTYRVENVTRKIIKLMMGSVQCSSTKIKKPMDRFWQNIPEVDWKKGV